MAMKPTRVVEKVTVPAGSQTIKKEPKVYKGRIHSSACSSCHPLILESRVWFSFSEHPKAIPCFMLINEIYASDDLYYICIITAIGFWAINKESCVKHWTWQCSSRGFYEFTKQQTVDFSPIKMLLSPMVWLKHRNGLNTEPVPLEPSVVTKFSPTKLQEF